MALFVTPGAQQCHFEHMGCAQLSKSPPHGARTWLARAPLPLGHGVVRSCKRTSLARSPKRSEHEPAGGEVIVEVKVFDHMDTGASLGPGLELHFFYQRMHESYTPAVFCIEARHFWREGSVVEAMPDIDNSDVAGGRRDRNGDLIGVSRAGVGYDVGAGFGHGQFDVVDIFDYDANLPQSGADEVPCNRYAEPVPG